MKLLLREYVASLKEREELDAILPDVLSELGFHVYSRPGRGTSQYGVDIAAVGDDGNGETKLFLLTVKRGDLTRQEWSADEQGLRASLNDILDVYVRSHIPAAYAHLKVVICICIGGSVRETVRERLSAFEAQHATDRISFQEWDGDFIAGMLASGVLREELLPRPLRSAFQKAVALVDEPDVSFDHFSKLLRDLHSAAQAPAVRVRSVRQIYLCLWVLYVWARDADNLEAAYRASERALLTTWDILRTLDGAPDEGHVALAFEQMVHLHMTIGEAYLNGRILPHVGVKFGLSMAVGSNSAVDINLKLFEVLGRLGQSALWLWWIRSQTSLEPDKVDVADRRITALCDGALALFENNPTLLLPLTDAQAIDVISAFLLFMAGGVDASKVHPWLGEMTDRLIYAVQLHRRYTTSLTDYRDLVEHPRERTKEYLEEATAGSTLIPFLAAWLAKVGDQTRLARLAALAGNELKHCTLQLWLPDEESEQYLYLDSDTHGRALCDLPVAPDGMALSEVLSEALKDYGDLQLSAHDRCWPLVILACRHWRLPAPPQYWFPSLQLDPLSVAGGADESGEPHGG